MNWVKWKVKDKKMSSVGQGQFWRFKGQIWCNTMWYKHVIPLLLHAVKYVYEILNSLKFV